MCVVPRRTVAISTLTVRIYIYIYIISCAEVVGAFQGARSASAVRSMVCERVGWARLRRATGVGSARGADASEVEEDGALYNIYIMKLPGYTA